MTEIRFEFEGMTFVDLPKSFACSTSAKTETLEEFAGSNPKHQSEIYSAFAPIIGIESEENMAFFVKSVSGDGKCLTHAIIEALNDAGIECVHNSEQLMTIALEYAFNHPIDGFEYEYDRSCPTSEPLIKGLSDLLGINIVVLNSSYPKPLTWINPRATDSIILFNMNCHYWCVYVHALRFKTSSELRWLISKQFSKL